tara:strand:+ start:854 stop:1027 length:174 start_codon:yes stop_codon:yes gene_type:complete
MLKVLLKINFSNYYLNNDVKKIHKQFMQIFKVTIIFNFKENKLNKEYTNVVLLGWIK